ncbi:hypothetical protein L9F63_001094, partial [Diploptera punctata]
PHQYSPESMVVSLYKSGCRATMVDMRNYYSGGSRHLCIKLYVTAAGNKANRWTTII